MKRLMVIALTMQAGMVGTSWGMELDENKNPIIESVIVNEPYVCPKDGLILWLGAFSPNKEIGVGPKKGLAAIVWERLSPKNKQRISTTMYASIIKDKDRFYACGDIFESNPFKEERTLISKSCRILLDEDYIQRYETTLHNCLLQAATKSVADYTEIKVEEPHYIIDDMGDFFGPHFEPSCGLRYARYLIWLKDTTGIEGAERMFTESIIEENGQLFIYGTIVSTVLYNGTLKMKKGKVLVPAEYYKEHESFFEDLKSKKSLLTDLEKNQMTMEQYLDTINFFMKR